jgi:nitric oxide reductase subunit C
MARAGIALLLFALYVVYSGFVYTTGTQSKLVLSPDQKQSMASGKQLYQDNNCQACHQIYGLGGYLGPDLTTAISDPKRGKSFVQALLRSGGQRMPNFHFDSVQIEQITTYLEYVDATAHTANK